jgi:hypothetical protein
MANWIVTSADSFARPTTVTAASEQSASGYGVVNLTTRGRPFLVYRSVDLTGEYVTFDFGTPVQVQAVVMINANFTTATWTAGSDGVTFGTSLGAFAVLYNEDVRRYMALQPVAMGSALRYLRMTPSAPLAGATFFELGEVHFLTAAAMSPLERNVGFPTTLQAQDISTLEFSGGGIEQSANGRLFRVYRLQQAVWVRGASDSHLNAIKRWFGTGRQTPHLIFENPPAGGVQSSAYLCVLEATPEIIHVSVNHFTTGPIVAREKIGGA